MSRISRKNTALKQTLNTEPTIEQDQAMETEEQEPALNFAEKIN